MAWRRPGGQGGFEPPIKQEPQERQRWSPLNPAQKAAISSSTAENPHGLPLPVGWRPDPTLLFPPICCTHSFLGASGHSVPSPEMSFQSPPPGSQPHSTCCWKPSTEPQKAGLSLLCLWHRDWHTGGAQEGLAEQLSPRERIQRHALEPGSLVLPCLGWGFLVPALCPVFPGTGGEGTFSGLLVKPTLLSLISAELVSIWFAMAGSLYAGGKLQCLLRASPRRPKARFLWLGMWDAPAASQRVSTRRVRWWDWKKPRDTTSSFWYLTPQRASFEKPNGASCFKIANATLQMTAMVETEPKRTPFPKSEGQASSLEGGISARRRSQFTPGSSGRINSNDNHSLSAYYMPGVV